MTDPHPLPFAEFAALYCARQNSTPDRLRAILREQAKSYVPDGWMLLECHAFDSSRFGSLTILPYGPRNTYTEVPAHLISPRGLASDMSVVIALLAHSAFALSEDAHAAW